MFLYTKTGSQGFPDGVLVRCVKHILPEAINFYPVGTVMEVCGGSLKECGNEDPEAETYGGIFATWELVEINQPLEELL